MSNTWKSMDLHMTPGRRILLSAALTAAVLAFYTCIIHASFAEKAAQARKEYRSKTALKNALLDCITVRQKAQALGREKERLQQELIEGNARSPRPGLQEIKAAFMDEVVRVEALTGEALVLNETTEHPPDLSPSSPGKACCCFKIKGSVQGLWTFINRLSSLPGVPIRWSFQKSEEDSNPQYILWMEVEP